MNLQLPGSVLYVAGSVLKFSIINFWLQILDLLAFLKWVQLCVMEEPQNKITHNRLGQQLCIYGDHIEVINYAHIWIILPRNGIVSF